MRSLHRLTNSAGSGTGTGTGTGSDHGTTTPQLVINHYHPGNGATNVDGSQSIELSFNENVEAGHYPTDTNSASGYIILKANSGTEIQIPVNDKQVTFSLNQVTIDPDQDLVADT